MTLRERFTRTLSFLQDRFDRKYVLVETTWWAELYETYPEEKLIAAVHMHTDDKDELLWDLIETLMGTCFMASAGQIKIVHEQDI